MDVAELRGPTPYRTKALPTSSNLVWNLLGAGRAESDSTEDDQEPNVCMHDHARSFQFEPLLLSFIMFDYFGSRRTG